MSSTNAFQAENTWFSRMQFSWRKKVPLVLQAQASECGIACLSMISQFFGNKVQLRELRQAMPVGQQGASLHQLINFAGHLGLSSRALKLDLHELSQLKTPAILHWEFSHFVVLSKVGTKHINIHDPAVGERRLTLKQFGQSFTGVALELAPNQSFTRANGSSKLSLGHFVGKLRGLKRQIALLIGLSVLIQGFALLAPFYMQTVIDKVLLSASSSLLMTLALGFGLLLIIETMCTWLREVVILRFSNLFNLHISNSVFQHLLSLPMKYFQTRHMGDIVSRFSSLQPVRDILTQGLVSAAIDGLLSITTLVVMFIYSWKLASIVLGFVILYSLLRWFLFYPVKRLNQEILQSDAKQQSYFMQSVRAIRTIKLANSQRDTQGKWLNYFVDNSNQRIQLGQWNIGFSTANKLLFGIENIVVIYVMASLVMANQFSVGMLFAFVSYKGRFIGASASLIEKFIEYKILNVHLSRLEDIVYENSELPEHYDNKLKIEASHRIREHQNLAMKSQQQGSAIKLNQMCFRYDGNSDDLLQNVNIEINSGDFIAIVGQSGCGKSTFLHCLLGLLVPSTGSIHIDEQALSPENRQQFNIAAVMQDDQLLNGSVLDNISQFAEVVDIQKVIQAAELACIHQDIMAMTMQYQTLIGDMGSSLSGGQKQRILLARAIYQTPKLLVLDEATSHLDIDTEAQVCANLKTLNTTIVMVAHRPQTIATAEKIYALSSIGLTEISYSNGNFQPKNNQKDNPDVR